MDGDRRDSDLTEEPIRFTESDEQLKGYALGCLEGCGMLGVLAVAVASALLVMLLA